MLLMQYIGTVWLSPYEFGEKREIQSYLICAVCMFFLAEQFNSYIWIYAELDFDSGGFKNPWITDSQRLIFRILLNLTSWFSKIKYTTFG